MTRGATSPDEYGEHGPHSTDRYAAIALDDESVLVYDVEAATGWVASDASVPLAEIR